MWRAMGPLIMNSSPHRAGFSLTLGGRRAGARPLLPPIWSLRPSLKGRKCQRAKSPAAVGGGGPRGRKFKLAGLRPRWWSGPGCLCRACVAVSSLPLRWFAWVPLSASAAVSRVPSGLSCLSCLAARTARTARRPAGARLAAWVRWWPWVPGCPAAFSPLVRFRCRSRCAAWQKHRAWRNAGCIEGKVAWCGRYGNSICA